MRDNICEEIDFILKGGLWRRITEVLAKYASGALIVEIKNDDMVVMEAVNTELDRLTFQGIGKEILSCSPEIASVHKLYFDNFSIPAISQIDKWTNAVRFHGKEWDIFILTAEAPSNDLLDALRPYLRVISHWISLRQSSQLEERLSILSYMILTTKNVLASVFEPMSIEDYAEFLCGVFRESFFAQKVAIFIDNGTNIKLLKGDDLGSPPREGIFASKILYPTPIVYADKEALEIDLDSKLIDGKSIFILPLTHSATDKTGFRLFCIGVLGNSNTMEMLNFMELLGNVASKALEIKYLHKTAEESVRQLNSRSYTVAAFYNVFQKLISYKERIDLLSFLLGFFYESSQAGKIKLVVYDTRECGYFLVGESLEGIAAQCFDPVTEVTERIVGNGEEELDESGLARLGFIFKDLPQCEVYPFWIGNVLEGFVAMHNIGCDAEMPDYHVVYRTFCQIAARELHFRLT